MSKLIIKGITLTMKLIIRKSILKKLSKSISLLEIDPISSVIFNFQGFNLLGLLLPKNKKLANTDSQTFLVKSSRAECEGVFIC